MFRLATKFKPTREAFETAVAAGYRHAEFWLGPEILADWEQVAALARQFPLEYALHFPNRKDLDQQALEQCVALYRALDCRAMVIHEPMHAVSGAELRRLGPDVKLAVENHRLSITDLDRWADRHEHLTLDVEHLWKFTLEDAPLTDLLASVERFLNRSVGRLRHVHMPGYLPGYDEHRPMYCAREMVLPVFTLLEAAGYEGFVVSEVNNEFQNARELQMDCLLFEQWQETNRQGLVEMDRAGLKSAG
ncbi:Xylose isomerase-like TIM barrel [Maioricimonas rarisocia]|uniref:Xylose isomerase-like TIM barrel n=1 Tax=Maioricimonas rarisocia TaxID=2528026 RepID=A0A517ZG11_9PLAN|nr:sugar phosphate isomerase/epimerase [Maioricimonas rarisocia]QDU41382.1 Xylose isomerase-like TIM barrel [Maioricimonas rarisocia]